MSNAQLKTNPSLLRAIKLAENRMPSQDELRAQRVSFIYGSLSTNSSVTRAQVQGVLDKQEGRPSV